MPQPASNPPSDPKRQYPAEFRREAVQLALSTDDSRASVARRLGVNETTLRNWVADHLAEEARQADPLAVTASEFEELRRLRREVAELRMEREILRQAAAGSTGQCNTWSKTVAGVR
jgi:transposase